MDQLVTVDILVGVLVFAFGACVMSMYLLVRRTAPAPPPVAGPINQDLDGRLRWIETQLKAQLRLVSSGVFGTPPDDTIIGRLDRIEQALDKAAIAREKKPKKQPANLPPVGV